MNTAVFQWNYFWILKLDIFVSQNIILFIFCHLKLENQFLAYELYKNTWQTSLPTPALFELVFGVLSMAALSAVAVYADENGLHTGYWQPRMRVDTWTVANATEELSFKF